MDKIDLDAIIEKVDKEFKEKYPHMGMAPNDAQKAYMKEAIRQVLVLASEKAKVYHLGIYEESEVVVDKQSILNVEKLIK